MACVYDTLEIGGVGILDPWKAMEGSSIVLRGAAWSCCQRAVLRRVQLAPARRCAKLSVEVWACKLWKQKADSC